MLFHGETSGDFAKCRLFYQATVIATFSCIFTAMVIFKTFFFNYVQNLKWGHDFHVTMYHSLLFFKWTVDAMSLIWQYCSFWCKWNSLSLSILFHHLFSWLWPKRNWKQCLCKILGDEQRALCDGIFCSGQLYLKVVAFTSKVTVWLSVLLEHTFLLFTVENLSHVVFFFQTWNARYLLSLSPRKPLTNGLARYVWNLWGIKSVNLMIPWFVDLRYIQETNWRTVYFAANS